MPTKTKPKPTARKPASSPRRPRQLTVPGTDAPKHRDVETAADTYVDVRDSRMALTKQETEASGQLLAAMKAHGLSVYRLETGEGNLLVTVTAEEKVSVRKEREKPARKAAGNGSGA
jgi:hypothetical protein